MKHILLVFLIISLFSCKKWLDVSSTTEIVSEQQFKDITGFRDAVVGVYVKLAKPELYSQDMTWLTVEFLSQQYAVVAGANNLNIPLYNWEASPLPTKRLNIWLGMYNAIANINQILRYQEKNRSAFSGYPITDSIIRGEMLALRAFIHFDLMRLYGKSNLGNRPQVMGDPAIPYVTDFSKTPTNQKSYTETLALLKKDIEEAIILLEADPIAMKRPSGYWNSDLAGNFLSITFNGVTSPNRRMRMNYWAARALHARILMWEGTSESKSKALKVALEVMGEPNSNGIGTGSGANYAWVTSALINKPDKFESDLAFVNEQLFTLQVENFYTIQTNSGAPHWFNASSPNNSYDVVFVNDGRSKEIFEYNNPPLYDIDWRRIRCMEGTGSALSNWEIRKLYNTLEMSESYSKRMPLIRISEMYYIAAECLLEPGENYNKIKAVACLNKVRNQRNIPAAYNLDPAVLSDADIRREITKEYMKEFIGEGQLFFYYKRLGFQNILGHAEEMSDLQYQMPMPDAEMINGGVRSN